MDIFEKAAEYYREHKEDVDKTMKEVVLPCGICVAICVSFMRIGYTKGYADCLIDIMNKNEGKFINF